MIRIVAGLVVIASVFVFSPERAGRTPPAIADDVAALARTALDPQAVETALARAAVDAAGAALAPTIAAPRRLARVDAARPSLDTLQPPDRRPPWRGTLDGR